MANAEQVKLLKSGAERWNQWREENPDERIDLTGADLSVADLRGADLREANLREANMREANMKGANLSNSDMRDATLLGSFLNGANLSGVNLSGAGLIGADLGHAELVGANLSKASLIFADLVCSNLNEANLDGIILAEVVFGRTSLKDVKGINKCEHRGPSIIDLETIALSGPLPPTFLRGCGLPDDVVSKIPEVFGMPVQYYSCFISHSHADKPFARRLYDALQDRGIRCWLDEHQMLPGDDLLDGIERGIRRWDKVLLCASKAALTSWWVDDEVDKALQKEQQLQKERGQKVLTLIPLNLDGYMFSKGYVGGKKSQLVKRVAADFTGWAKDNDKFEAQLERVVKALKLGGREKPPEPKL